MNGTCPGDLADVCSTYHLDACPPQLDELLDDAHWPPRVPDTLDVGYEVCGDGSSYVGDFDQKRKNTTWRFAFEGNELTYFGGQPGGAQDIVTACGALPDHAPGTLCRNCIASDTEPLDRASDGPGQWKTIGGLWRCQVDDENRLVMAPNAEPTAGTCDAMRVGDDGSACTGTARYYWNGTVCMPFLCDACVGEDCSRLFESADDCDRAYVDCYLPNGINRFCDVDADCTLERRGCCGSCGLTEANGLIGIAAEYAGSFEDLCADTACPSCVSSVDANAYAFCSKNIFEAQGFGAGQCSVGTR